MIVALLFSAAMLVEQTAPSGGAPPTPVAATPVGTTAPAPAPATGKTAKVDPDRVCKLEPLLGSKITKKVCYNRAEMAERTFYDKQNLDRMQAQTPGPLSN